jgi:hypothetical protein
MAAVAVFSYEQQGLLESRALTDLAWSEQKIASKSPVDLFNALRLFDLRHILDEPYVAYPICQISGFVSAQSASAQSDSPNKKLSPTLASASSALEPVAAAAAPQLLQQQQTPEAPLKGMRSCASSLDGANDTTPTTALCNDTPVAIIHPTTEPVSGSGTIDASTIEAIPMVTPVAPPPQQSCHNVNNLLLVVPTAGEKPPSPQSGENNGQHPLVLSQYASGLDLMCKPIDKDQQREAAVPKQPVAPLVMIHVDPPPPNPKDDGAPTVGTLRASHQAPMHHFLAVPKLCTECRSQIEILNKLRQTRDACDVMLSQTHDRKRVIANGDVRLENKYPPVPPEAVVLQRFEETTHRIRTALCLLRKSKKALEECLQLVTIFEPDEPPAEIHAVLQLLTTLLI